MADKQKQKQKQRHTTLLQDRGSVRLGRGKNPIRVKLYILWNALVGWIFVNCYFYIEREVDIEMLFLWLKIRLSMLKPFISISVALQMSSTLCNLMGVTTEPSPIGRKRFQKLIQILHQATKSYSHQHLMQKRLIFNPKSNRQDSISLAYLIQED